MPVLVQDRGNWYIRENSTVSGKSKRVTLKKLGRITKKQATTELVRYELSARSRIVTLKTFGGVYDEFLVWYRAQSPHSVRPRTVELFEVMSRHFLSRLRDLATHQIKFETLENIKAECLAKGLSNRSTNIVLVELKKVLKFALKRELLHLLPPFEMLSQQLKNEILRLSTDEVRRLLDRAGEDIKFYITLMINTGMRPYECLMLDWRHVSLSAGTVTIVSNNKLKRGRTIPINAALKKALEISPVKEGRVCPFSRSDVVGKKLRLLGKRLDPPIQVNPYSLRKTFGSIMAENGVPVLDLAKIMGHANIQTTYKYYVNLNQEVLKAAMSRLPDFC